MLPDASIERFYETNVNITVYVCRCLISFFNRYKTEILSHNGKHAQQIDRFNHFVCFRLFSEHKKIVLNTTINFLMSKERTMVYKKKTPIRIKLPDTTITWCFILWFSHNHCSAICLNFNWKSIDSVNFSCKWKNG